MAKIATDVSGAILLPNLIQVTDSISGSVVPLAMFEHMIGLVASTRVMRQKNEMVKGKILQNGRIGRIILRKSAFHDQSPFHDNIASTSDLQTH